MSWQPRALTLYLLRHGESEWSITRQHTGSTDLGRPARGKNEARALFAASAGVVFPSVLVSPRLRARQTCDLAGLVGLAQACHVVPELAEWNHGRYEGMTSAEIRLGNPAWSLWRDGCPGGESPAEVGARTDRLLAKLCTLDGNVAVFSHGQFSAALAVRWIGLGMVEGQHFALHTGSVGTPGFAAQHANQRTIRLCNEPSLKVFPAAMEAQPKPWPLAALVPARRVKTAAAAGWRF